MNRVFVIVIVGLSGLVVSLGALLLSQTSQGKRSAIDAQPQGQVLLIDPPAVDFGEVVQGDTAKAEVTISNVSDGTVTFKVNKSCGCTSAEVGSTELAPGGSTRLRVAVDTTTKAGPFTEAVFVSLNEKPEAELVVPLLGQARRVIAYTPDKIAFGEVRHRSEAFQQIVLRSLNGNPLLIENLTTWTNSVSVELFDMSETQAVLNVSLPAHAKPGKIRDFVVVDLSAPLKRTEHIPVTGLYTGELSAEPAKLSWHQLSHQNWHEMVLEAKVQQIDGKQFAIKRVLCTDGRFTASVEPLSEVDSDGRADSFLAKVALSKPIGEADAQAVLIIEGDLSDDARLEIPIHVSRRD
jgi:hypothetical protein